MQVQKKPSLQREIWMDVVDVLVTCAQVSEHAPSEAWKRQLLRDDPKLHWLDSSVNQLNDGKTGGA